MKRKEGVMKKVLAILASPRKQETARVLSWIEESLTNRGDIAIETIFLPDMHISMCKGCFNCLSRGEKYCPLQKDDVAVIYQKMVEADGLIFATPVYSLQVTAYLKNLLDRLAFVFHRPAFFHKTFLGVVTQGVYGDKKTLQYLNETAKFWGFKTIQGFTATTPPEMLTQEDYTRIKEKAEASANRFYQGLKSTTLPKPSLLDVIIFRMNRTIKPFIKETSPYDYGYFESKGWLSSPYYYDVRLNPIAALIGWVMDKQGKKLGQKIARNYQKAVSEKKA